MGDDAAAPEGAAATSTGTFRRARRASVTLVHLQGELQALQLDIGSASPRTAEHQLLHQRGQGKEGGLGVMRGDRASMEVAAELRACDEAIAAAPTSSGSGRGRSSPRSSPTRAGSSPGPSSAGGGNGSRRSAQGAASPPWKTSFGGGQLAVPGLSPVEQARALSQFQERRRGSPQRRGREAGSDSAGSPSAAASGGRRRGSVGSYGVSAAGAGAEAYGADGRAHRGKRTAIRAAAAADAQGGGGGAAGGARASPPRRGRAAVGRGVAGGGGSSSPSRRPAAESSLATRPLFGEPAVSILEPAHID
jgi:hypothetical protein